MTVTVAIVVSVATSVGAAVGAAAVGSAAASAAGGAGGAASSGADGGGGTVVPLVLGVQRFASMSDLSGAKSDVTDGVAGSMRWASGDLGIVTNGGVGRRRRLDDGTTMPVEMVSLLNILITCFVAVALVMLAQLLLVQMWRKWVNRKYYRMKGTVKGTIGFVPFPKSLVWPNALFFVVCVFGFGLTRASVRLLAAQPPACDTGCYALASTVLAVLVGIGATHAGPTAPSACKLPVRAVHSAPPKPLHRARRAAGGHRAPRDRRRRVAAAAPERHRRALEDGASPAGAGGCR